MLAYLKQYLLQEIIYLMFKNILKIIVYPKFFISWQFTHPQSIQNANVSSL